MADFNADYLASVLKIVMVQADAIEELQVQVEALWGTTLVRSVERLSARLAQLEQAQASGFSELRGRLLLVEVRQMQAHYAALSAPS